MKKSTAGPSLMKFPRFKQSFYILVSLFFILYVGVIHSEEPDLPVTRSIFYITDREKPRIPLSFAPDVAPPFLPESQKLERIESSLENYVQKAVASGWMPAASVAIYWQNLPLVDADAGLSDERVVPIASLTKSFTAVMVMQLAERGFLELDRPVAEIPYSIPGDTAKNPITLRHLLQHTSGIPYGGHTSVWTPGTRFQYSNQNYRYLAEIIQKVSHLSYPDYLQKNILTPLGMDHTRCSSVYVGHSGISSTRADLNHFGIMLASGGQFRGVRILRKESLVEMVQPPSYLKKTDNMDYYSHGFRVEVRDGHIHSFYHTGVWNGTLAEVRVFPEDGLHVVQLATPPSYEDPSFKDYRWKATDLSNRYISEFRKSIDRSAYRVSQGGDSSGKSLFDQS